MIGSSENNSDDSPNLEKMLAKSSEKAVKAISKNEFIEKQNVEMKRLLKMLPFQIFLLVADADQEIDPKEVVQFKEFISQRKKHVSNQYTLRMFHNTVVNYTALTNRYYQGKIKKDISIVEKCMWYIQMCVSQSTIIKICHDLRELTIAIAEASGGFMGMTSPISKEEEAVIQKLDSIFDNTIDQAGQNASEQKWGLEF